MNYKHIPVMLPEVLQFLDVKDGASYLDCTLGGAGYTVAIAKLAGENGQVLSVDLDDLALANAQEKISALSLKNIILVQDNFRNIDKVVAEKLGDNFLFDGVVMDLGLSSAQLDDEQRGFSFQGDRPLDMAFNQELHTAIATTTVVNRYPLERLTYVFREYGGEAKAYQLAKKIIEVRKKNWIKTTSQLLEVINSVIKSNPGSRINPATKVFQALRMETNRELEALKEALPLVVKLLKPGGVIAVVSFHSGEDKIVKDFFRQENKDCICANDVPLCVCKHHRSLELLTKKALPASEQESAENPRARSAKLRVARKI